MGIINNPEDYIIAAIVISGLWLVYKLINRKTK